MRGISDLSQGEGDLTILPSGSCGFSMRIEAGIDWVSKAPRILPTLLIPAAVSMCPTLDLTEPNRGKFSPKKSEIDSASMRSPKGVPVAWHSR